MDDVSEWGPWEHDIYSEDWIRRRPHPDGGEISNYLGESDLRHYEQLERENARLIADRDATYLRKNLEIDHLQQLLRDAEEDAERLAGDFEELRKWINERSPYLAAHGQTPTAKEIKIGRRHTADLHAHTQRKGGSDGG